MSNIEEMRYWLDRAKSINESSNPTTNDSTFEMKEYRPDSEGWDYIKANKQQIWDFLDEGYKRAGYERFLGCDKPNNLYKNANLVRIAFCGNEWVAISVYTGYRGGFKCVGITATTNENFRNSGIAAVHSIIKKDIGNFKQFYWTECSGSVEKLYERYKGIKIPNDYAFGIVQQHISKYLDDGFHYEREIKGEIQQKIIYGFNNEQTYQKVRAEREKYIEDSINAIIANQINESVEKPSFGRLSKLQCAVAVVNFFVDQRWEGCCYDFPNESLNKLGKYLEIIRSAIENNEVPENEKKITEMALENGTYVLKTSSPMEVHSF